MAAKRPRFKDIPSGNRKNIFDKVSKDITRSQLKQIESKSKKYPCSVSNNEIKIAYENIEEAFGYDSKYMERLKKIVDKRNKCK